MYSHIILIKHIRYTARLTSSLYLRGRGSKLQTLPVNLTRLVSRNRSEVVLVHKSSRNFALNSTFLSSISYPRRSRDPFHNLP